jgi:hypothetical protein
MASIKNTDNFMYAGDIPNVIGYLESAGYKIMADVTNMAYSGPVDFASSMPGTYSKRQLIFMFRYEGK